MKNNKAAIDTGSITAVTNWKNHRFIRQHTRHIKQVRLPA